MPAKQVDLSGIYLLGSDGVPLRAEIKLRRGHLECQKRATGPAALAILWPVGESGKILLETTRLPERADPYSLEVELLRGRLMRVNQKHEEWGIIDAGLTAEQVAAFDACREALIESFKLENAADAAATAQAGLERAVALGEAFAVDSAGSLLDRRHQVGGFSRRVFGCVVDPYHPDEAAMKRLADGLDFAVLPVSWKRVEPNEQEFDWAPLDACVEWLAKHRVPVKGTGLVCFTEECIPDWLYIWEHDFDTVRDLIYDHIRRVISRYGNFIQVWDVISGIHATNCFSFNFEQLMELTRMSAAITRQLAPQSTVIVDLVFPWGEYYARNQRTIPPMLYADMVAQTGIHFDAFGLRLCFGVGADGMFVRDLFQISAMLDRFASLGKPVHVTAVQVPSSDTGLPDDAWKGQMSPASGGVWRSPWNEAAQAEWLKGFYEIALSKPFVETISWRGLSDAGRHYLPGGGLLRADGTPKPAFARLTDLRASITVGPSATTEAAGESSTPR